MLLNLAYKQIEWFDKTIPSKCSPSLIWVDSSYKLFPSHELLMKPFISLMRCQCNWTEQTQRSLSSFYLKIQTLVSALEKMPVHWNLLTWFPFRGCGHHCPCVQFLERREECGAVSPLAHSTGSGSRDSPSRFFTRLAASCLLLQREHTCSRS